MCNRLLVSQSFCLLRYSAWSLEHLRKLKEQILGKGYRQASLVRDALPIAESWLGITKHR